MRRTLKPDLSYFEMKLNLSLLKQDNFILNLFLFDYLGSD